MTLDRPARHRDRGLRWLVGGVALAWAALQLWFASPLGLLFVDLSLNEAEARSVHLAVALFLAGLLGTGPRIIRLALAAAGALAAGYIVASYSDLAARPGHSTAFEVGLAVVGLGLLLVASWRLVAPALAVLCAVALAASMAVGGSVVEMVQTQWFSTRGVFGAPLGLSTQFLLLGTVFAVLLGSSGAPRHWARLLRRVCRPDAAPQVAFVERLLAGLAAPSTLVAARIGRTAAGRWPTRAAAGVALAAAIASQAVPPLLGYAITVVPGTLRLGGATLLGSATLIGALLLAGMALLLRGTSPPRANLGRRAGWLMGAGLLVLAGAGAISGFAEAKASYGGVVSWIAGLALGLLYLVLRWRELRLDSGDLRRLILAALRSILPFLMLVWGILVEGLDPGLVAFWAIGFIVLITFAAAFLQALLYPHIGLLDSMLRATRGLTNAVVRGVARAVPIAIASAAAGLLIAAAATVELPRLLTAALDWTIVAGALPAVLGLGTLAAVCGALLPTAPAYLLVSVTVAPVLLDLGVRAGSAMPLLAAHLSLLYCAIAGNALPGASLRQVRVATAPFDRDIWRRAVRLLAPLIALALALPFNGELLTLGQPRWIEPLWALAGAGLGLIGLAVLLSREWRRGRPVWEIALVGLAVASLLAPRLWLDAWLPGIEPVDARRLVAIAGSLPAEAGITIIVDRARAATRPYAITVPLGALGGGAERLASAGVELRQEGELVKVARVVPASWADRTGLSGGATVLMVQAPVGRPSRGFVLVPAGALALWLVRRRRPGPKGKR